MQHLRGKDVRNVDLYCIWTASAIWIKIHRSWIWSIYCFIWNLSNI